jgi:hypothetical protein
VLDPKLKVADQILLLISSSASGCSTDDLFRWIGTNNRGYFNKLLRELHGRRFIELATDEASVQMLPPGEKYVEENLVRNVV